MDLNLRQVRAFVSVAQLKSFTRAASLLHVSQPALTVQIRKLEESLRSRLLDRNSRSVDLTRAGRDLLPQMQRMLQEADAIVVDSHAQSAGQLGTVRIASLPSLAASLLPDVILACRQRMPQLRFVVRDAIADRVLALVQSDEVDLALAGGEVPDSQFETLHRSSDRLCIVCRSDDPIARRRVVRMADLVDLPLVLTDAATSVRTLIDGAFRDLGRVPTVACETTYMTTAVAMVRAGLGVTILPESAREAHVEPSLKIRAIDGTGLTRTLSIVKKRHRTLPPAAEAFLPVCIEAMRRPGPAS